MNQSQSNTEKQIISKAIKSSKFQFLKLFLIASGVNINIIALLDNTSILVMKAFSKPKMSSYNYTRLNSQLFSSTICSAISESADYEGHLRKRSPTHAYTWLSGLLWQSHGFQTNQENRWSV